MADDPKTDDIDEPTGDEPQTPPDPLAALEAKFEQRFAAQATENQASLHTLGTRLAEVTGGYNALLASQNAGNKPPVEEAMVTPKEIADCYEAGEFQKAAELSIKAANQAARREGRVIRETEVEPLRGLINNVGMPSLANLSNHMVASALPETARTFYDKHRAAVDQHLAAMPPEARVDANAIKGALAYEIGMAALNGGLETQVNDEVERRIRSGNQPGNLKVGGGRNVGSQTADYEKIFGAGGAAAAEEAGGWDRFAQKMGYEDMSDYCVKTGVTTPQ